MSHNKIFKIYKKLPAIVFSKGDNQRYKLLKPKPNDIFMTASHQSIADFVYSAYKIF